MKYFLLCFLIIVLISCENEKVNSVNSDTNKTIVNNSKRYTSSDDENGIFHAEIITDTNKMQMKLSKDTVHLDDTLIINFKTPHNLDFAIRTSYDEHFFLHQAASEEKFSTLKIENDFQKQKNISFVVKSFKARPYVFGAKEMVPIFTKTGYYTFQLSENIDTDDGTPVEEKIVYFINKNKR